MDTNALHTSHKTHYFSSTNTNPLMLHREVTDLVLRTLWNPQHPGWPKCRIDIS